MLTNVLRYAGSSVRAGELFGAKSLMAAFARTISHGLKGVENAFIQHVPLLYDTLKNLVASKLSERSFPFEGASHTRDRPQDIIVYMTGGCTFEESVCIERFMRETPGVTVLLGGSTVHNSHTFLQDVARFAAQASSAGAAAGAY